MAGFNHSHWSVFNFGGQDLFSQIWIYLKSYPLDQLSHIIIFLIFVAFNCFLLRQMFFFCLVNKFVATNNFSHKKWFHFGVCKGEIDVDDEDGDNEDYVDDGDGDNEDGNTNNIHNDSVYAMDSLWRRLRDGWFSFLVVDAYYRNKTIHIDLKSENMLIFVDAMSEVADFSQVIVKFWFFNQVCFSFIRVMILLMLDTFLN